LERARAFAARRQRQDQEGPAARASCVRLGPCDNSLRTRKKVPFQGDAP
jgi:hypothetical protein